MSMKPHHVVALAYPNLCLFEFGIAAELFGLSRPELDVCWYRFSVAMTAGQVRSGIGGLQLVASGGLELLAKADTIVIPGWTGTDVRPEPTLRNSLREAFDRGARLMSICSGAFLLGHCGLLDGRKATTHWRYEQRFREQFPSSTLVADALYVEDATVITSAGSAAGIDAGLHLIRADFGTAVANRVAQRLVMLPHREGGQRQFVESPVPRQRHDRFDGVFDWARQHLHTGVAAADLARAAAMSERNFYRRFRQALGTTPAHWLQQERVRVAKALLEESQLDLVQVAESCGFETPEAFRAVFRRAVGVAPSIYRRSFGYRQTS
ncbi:transcriptional regulator FtrA [Frateuria aurantia]